MYKMQKVKMTIVISLALMLVFSAIFGGCTTPAEQEEEEEPIILKWNTYVSPTSVDGAIMPEIAQAIEERTGGMVKVELYYFGTLTPVTEILDSVRTGLADIGDINPAYTPGVLPKTEIKALPQLWPVGEAGEAWLDEIAEAYLNDEWEDTGLKVISWNRYGISPWFVYQIWSREPLRSLDDFEGQQVGTFTEAMATALASIGFAPLHIPGSESYMNLEQGVSDCHAMIVMAAKSEHFEEVCSAVTKINLSAAPLSAMAMNIESYNNLPSDLRDIVVEELTNYTDSTYEGMRDAVDESWQHFESTPDFEIIELTEAEHQIIAEAVEPALENWIVNAEAAGMSDAREFAEYCLEVRDSISE
jgi:TRAP-type C4-dicarboxylate transport system substrate-binding protein